MASACRTSADGTSISLPGASAGAGFDYIGYFPELQQIVIPGGRTGNLYMIDPGTLNVSTITGFTSSAYYDGHKDTGTTSIAVGQGFIFANDTGKQTINMVDPYGGGIVASAPTFDYPDDVGYVASTNEVWVGEGGSSLLEIFSVSTSPPAIVKKGEISFGIPCNDSNSDTCDDAPEGQAVVDEAKGLAYMGYLWPNTGQPEIPIAVVDIHSRTVIDRWPAKCTHAHDRHFDKDKGFLLVTCADGATVLDTNAGGKVVSHLDLANAAGFDTTGYNAALRHWYLVGDHCSDGNILQTACLVVLGVSDAGQLSELGRFRASPDDEKPTQSLAVSGDDRNRIWYTDSFGGKVWYLDDPYPETH
jgi:hypothetical protein